MIQLTLLVAFVMGCRSNRATVTKASVEEKATWNVEKEIHQMPALLTDSVYGDLIHPARVFKFYHEVGNVPVWQDQRTKLLADSLLYFIRNARYYGLLRTRYHFEELSTPDILRPSDRQLIRNDVLLTDAFITLANDLRHGQTALLLSAQDSVYIPLLIQTLKGGHLKELLESQEPKFDGYRSLKNSLLLLLDTARSDERRLLLSEKSVAPLAIQRRLQLIEINLERWRREKLPFAVKYLLVNIPSFSLQVIDSGKVLLESKVVVGKTSKPTPLLTSRIDCISLYPFWHVPRKISVEEFLPLLQKDTSFLRRNKFDVLDRKGRLVLGDTLQWDRYNVNYFPFTLRQRQGQENSLGLIKFMFDNPYAVYLHDTNNKAVFRAERRALSHGCVRVEKASVLAHYLATENLEHQSKVIAKYLLQKESHQVSLLHPIPIYIRYFTCESMDNAFSEFADVYGMDREIEKLLYGNSTNSSPLPDMDSSHF